MKKKLDIDKLLSQAAAGPSRWELDNITWNDRASNPITLRNFLKRIKDLEGLVNIDGCTPEEKVEYEILVDLANDLDEQECEDLLSNNDSIMQQHFIESLARKGAVEILTRERVTFDTMIEMCKLSPNDFILTAKRTQDLINSIHELVIQGETLSQDVAGA